MLDHPFAVLEEALGEEIDEAADLGREMVAMPINRINGKFHRLIAWKWPYETPLGKIIRNNETRRLGHALSQQGEETQRFSAVGDDIASDMH